MLVFRAAIIKLHSIRTRGLGTSPGFKDRANEGKVTSRLGEDQNLCTEERVGLKL